MTESRRHDLAAITVLIAVPSLFFLDVLLGWSGFYLLDVSQYYFPAKKLLREIVLSGQFPYWNPWFSAGQPMAANPEHEVFYPLTWLILLPDFVHAFQILALSHVYLATFSMYALLRSCGTTRASAVIGGLSFGLGGFVLSSLNFFPILFSAAWLPLTCLFTRRFLHERAPRMFVFATAAFGMQLLVGEPFTVLQTGLILGMYALFHGERRTGRMLRDVALVGAISIAALLVSAVQTLPTLDHYRDSVRAQGLAFEIVEKWSTPPLRFAEVVFPSVLGTARPDTDEPYWGSHLYGERSLPFYLSVYSGLLIVSMAFAGVTAGIRGRGLYVSICAVSILLALGSHTPLLRWLYDLGVARSVRYSEKFLMTGIFATVVFGALAFDALLRGNLRIRRIAIAFAGGTAVFAAIAAGLTYTPGAADSFRALWRFAPDFDVDAMLASSRSGWFMATVRGAVLAFLIFFMTRIRSRFACALASVFVVADLGMFVSQIAPREPRAFFTEPPPTIRDLAPNRDEYRIFQLSEWSDKARNRMPYTGRRPHAFVLHRNSLGGVTAAAYGLRGVMEIDYDLTSLAVTDDFERAAWGLQEKMPQYWLGYVAAMSNIRYVSLFQPFEAEVRRAGGDIRRMRPIRFIEGNPSPRYYFAPQVVTARTRTEFVNELSTGRYSKQAAFIEGPAFVPAPGRVLRWSETSNSASIEVECAGHCFLVMSVTAHKYWTVTIDGRGVPSITTNRGYQGVHVPAGRHAVAMRYRNPLVAVGAAISVITILALMLVSRWRKRD
jgi:hypothetical protein